MARSYLYNTSNDRSVIQIISYEQTILNINQNRYMSVVIVSNQNVEKNILKYSQQQILDRDTRINDNILLKYNKINTNFNNLMLHYDSVLLD